MAEHQYTQQPKKTDNTSQKQTIPPKQIPSSHPTTIIQRARINPKSLTHADVMQLQRTIGNRAVGRLLTEIGLIPSISQQPPPVQMQTISEEEKEPLQGKKAEAIQRRETPEEEEPLQGKMIGTIQRQEPEEEEKLQMKPVVQRQEIPEDEEPLQSKFTDPLQHQEIPDEEELLQGKFESKPEQEMCPSCSASPIQREKENRTGILDDLKAGVESLSDLSIAQGTGDVLQMVGPGHYKTNAVGNLRDINKKSIALIPPGTKFQINVEPCTRRFTTGFLIGAKDHTWVNYNEHNKSGWIRDEILEPMPPTIVHTRVIPPTSKPETFSTSTGFGEPASRAYSPSTDFDVGFFPGDEDYLRSSAPPMRSGSSTLPESREPVDETAALVTRLMSQKGQVLPHIEEAFKRLNFYMHFTHEEYLRSIQHVGLKPGYKKGIGFASSDFSEATGGDDSCVYVVSGSPTGEKTMGFVAAEAESGTVVVLSSTKPVPDLNYSKSGGGAYYFTGSIPPARDYITEPLPIEGKPETISLVIPLSDEDRKALASLISDNITTGPEQVNPYQAEFLLMRELFRRYRLRFFKYSKAFE